MLTPRHPSRARLTIGLATTVVLAALPVGALRAGAAPRSVFPPTLTELVSANSSGASANGFGGLGSLSADARYVAWDDDSTNLVPGDTNGSTDAFVRDMITDLTERVDVSTAGAQANGVVNTPPSISRDGRYVAFSSDANNLVAGDTNGVADVFVRDRT